MTIQAFVFDCGGVLLHNDAETYRTWEARLGLPPGDLIKSLWAGEVWSRAEVGALTDVQFWQCVAEQIGVHDPAEIATLSAEMWDAWRLDPQVLALIDRVRERYRVAMLSNATDALDAVLIERYCVADRFEFIGNSARLGVAKPNPAAFQAVLERLKLQPEEVVFVDDRADNIAAAAALGLHVIWFVNARELERQLEVYLSSPLSRGGLAAVAETADQEKALTAQ